MRYSLFGHTPDKGQWTWKKEVAEQAIENYERFLEEGGGRTLAQYWLDTGKKLKFIRPDEDNYPMYWRAPAEEQLIDTVWSGIPVYSNKNNYPTEKSEQLLTRIIEMASDEGDVILDAFSGSGTTAAVSELCKRRWIAIDVGKLSIYTTQKRLLEMADKDPIYSKSSFTLMNAGLYDFSKLSSLPWSEWRFFALSLFQCKDEPHSLAKIEFDGYRDGYDVLVFNHKKHSRAVVDEDYIASLHKQIAGKVEGDVYIIAPAASVKFLQDYIEIGETKYWVLRIPYSIINELHSSDFETVLQPIDAKEVNSLAESVGFDFMNTPQVKLSYELKVRDGMEFMIIELDSFQSKALLGDSSQFRSLDDQLSGREKHLSSVLIDLDYRNRKHDDISFTVDKVFYANDLQKKDYRIEIPIADIGNQFMLILIDIYGNEYTEMKSRREITEKVNSDAQ